MKKRLVCFFCFLCIWLSISTPVFAADSVPRLVDEADCLTDSEEKNVLSLLDEISTRQQMDLVIVTVPSLGGKTSEAYADDFYDYNGYSKDGILLLVAVESRDWAISTSGYGIKALTDYGLKHISKLMVPHLSEGDYEKAFTTFANTSDEFIRMAKDGKPYDEPIIRIDKKRIDKVNLLCESLIVGLIGAWIITRRMKKKLISVQTQSAAADYVLQGSMNVTRRGKEIFLRSVVTHTSKAEKKSESSGGSTTHTSSSGETHGGDSGTF